MQLLSNCFTLGLTREKIKENYDDFQTIYKKTVIYSLD